MSVETVSYISNFNILWPLDTDIKSEGDDHIRELKNGIYGTFSNVAAESRCTHNDLNYASGLSATAFSRIDTLSASIGAQNVDLNEISIDIANISASLNTLSASIAYTETIFYSFAVSASSSVSHQVLNFPSDWSASDGLNLNIIHNFGDTNYVVLHSKNTENAVFTKTANDFQYRHGAANGVECNILVIRKNNRLRIDPTVGGLVYTGAQPTIT